MLVRLQLRLVPVHRMPAPQRAGTQEVMRAQPQADAESF